MSFRFAAKLGSCACLLLFNACVPPHAKDAVEGNSNLAPEASPTNVSYRPKKARASVEKRRVEKIQKTRNPSQAKEGPKDYVTPPETNSPDGHYGVRVLVFDAKYYMKGAPEDTRRNQVVDLTTGRIAAVIATNDPAYDREVSHHGTGQARWSGDGSLLLWYVDGKWTPDVVALVKLEHNRAKWQIDILKTGQQALLKRTREAEPEKYAAAKKENSGDGSAYPDGFTVDVTTEGEEGRTVTLPLAVRVDLTANPKKVEGYPANLDSYLDGVVKEDGTFEVRSFHLGSRMGKEW